MQEQYQRPTPTNHGNQASVASRDELDRAKKGTRYKRAIYEHICLYGTQGSTSRRNSGNASRGALRTRRSVVSAGS